MQILLFNKYRIHAISLGKGVTVCKAYFLSLLLMLLSTGEVFSQTQSGQILKEIENDYRALNYKQAVQKAKDALLDYHQFTPSELVELHKYLALTNFALGRVVESKKQFKTALSLNPDLVLSPLYVSPKIIEFLNQVKTEFKAESSKPDELVVKYVVVKDKRFNAGLRSMALPGWGHLYKGEGKKGIVIISLWSASLGGLLITHLKQRQALQDYVAAEELDDIESRYDVYNKYYQARNSIAVFAIAIWLYAHIDAMIKKTPNSAQYSYQIKQPSLFPRVNDHQILLTYTYRF